MDWQFTFSIGAIAFAASYLAWRSVGVWRSTRKGGCSGGCGCAKPQVGVDAPAKLVAPEQLILRERPK